MRRSTLMLALAVGALLGLARAQSDFTIGLGETRTGTIPRDQIEHRYVLDLPAGTPRLTVAVTAGGADADLEINYLPTGERLFLDVSSDPNPSFTIEAPSSGGYEILVKNLLWQPLSYVLRVSGEALTAAPPPLATEEYFVAVDGAAVGPMSLAALEERVIRGTTVAEDLVWRPGLDAWVRADALPELAARFVSRPTPPPLPPAVSAPAPVAPPVAPPSAPPTAVGDEALPDLRVTVGCRGTARDADLRGLAVGDRALVTCPAGCSAAVVWGTDAYTDDSTICSAAAHAGVIDLSSGGSFVLTIQGARQSYEGSVRNGISTRPYGSWSRSYALTGIGAAVDPPRPEPGAKPDKPGGAGYGGAAPNPGRLASERVPLGTLRGTLSNAGSEARHLVTVDRDGDLEVRASADLNVVLHLVDANGSTLASDTSGYARERAVTRTGVAPGAYTVVVSRDGGSSEGGYAIAVELVANATRNDDEPNDAADAARPTPVDALATGRLGYGDALRRDTEDWFRFTTVEDGDLTVRVDADPALQIVLHLYGAEGRATLATDTSGWSSSRTVTVEGLARGSYLLRVARDGSSGEGGYAIVPAYTGVATPGDAEPNDTREQAQAIAVDAVAHGRLGYGDGSRTDTEDHLVVTMTRPGDLTLSVRAGLDVVLILTDANGSTLATDTSGYSTQRSVGRADLPAGRYLLRIARDGSSGRGAYVVEPRFIGR